MKKIPLISIKTTQSHIRKDKKYNSVKIITGKQLEDTAIYSQNISHLKKQTKPIYTKQQSTILQQVIYGQVLETDKNTITLRCLIDENERLFQKRRFDRQFLEGTVNFLIGQLVEIKIYLWQGKVKFTLANANRQDLVEKFEPKDYFSKFADSVLFQPLPLHIDEDNF